MRENERAQKQQQKCKTKLQKIISAKKRTRQMSYGNDRDEMKMNVTQTTLSS